MGDEGDEPMDELSVTEVPLERGDVEDASEWWSEFRDESDDTEETFRNILAASTSGAL
jgi:hypothetical protein